MMNAVAKLGADTTQRISREDWVRDMTRGSPWAERADHDKGTLLPGMLADIAVLSQDIFAVGPSGSRECRTVMPQAATA